tara:strand:- start:193 stop:642 length:450 start_codon:yes stop_codon:yes gene_type:complete
MIRPAKTDDLRFLAEMSKDYYSEHWFSEHTEFDLESTFNNMRAYTITPQANLLVASVTEGLVGYSIGFIVPIVWSKQLRYSIAYNYIEPAFRKQGIFEEFIQAHEEFAKKHKCVDMNIGDGAQYKGKFGSVARSVGFDQMGTDAYRRLI